LPKEICACETIEKSTKAHLKVYTTQKRFKKYVTVVEGLQGEEVVKVAKELKHKLACGGSSKGGVVVLQGDHKSEVVGYLKKLGYPPDIIKVG
jgi:translation initiation factor 1